MISKEQNINKLLENKNFLNNQNYILSRKNRYASYGNESDFITLGAVVFLLTIITFSLIIFIIFQIIIYFFNEQVSYFFDYEYHKVWFVFWSSILIVGFFLGNILEYYIFKFLIKGKKYLLLKKNPKLINLSLDNEKKYNIDSFVFLKLDKKISFLEKFKNNIVDFISILLVSCIFGMVIYAWLGIVLVFVYPKYNKDHTMWGITYIISVIIAYIYLLLNKDKK